MRKNYQNREIDTNQAAVPETVNVALDELAARGVRQVDVAEGAEGRVLRGLPGAEPSSRGGARGQIQTGTRTGGQGKETSSE